MKKKLQTAIVALACMAFGHNVSAQTTVTYDFNSDAVASPATVAGLTLASTATVNVVAGSGLSDGNTTNLLQPATFVGTSTASIVGDLTNIPTATDYSVTWKEYITTGTTQLKKGFLLRGSGVGGYTTGIQQGYIFLVQNETTTGTVTFRILNSNSTSTITSIAASSATPISGFAVNKPCWFRASIIGNFLRFEYSSNGTTWTSGLTVLDNTYTSGTTQLYCGLGSSNTSYMIDDVVFNVIAPTTWDGTAWDNGTPAAGKRAIITGNYTETGTLTATALDVKGTAIVSVPSGKNFNIFGGVNVDPTASLTFENNANLIQQSTSATTTNKNTGNIVVKRNSSALSRLDYTLWSSPVAAQNLAAFSPLTSLSPSRFYNYVTATNLYSAIANPTTTSFSLGNGCLIRMPNTAVAYPSTETFTGIFTGVPNSGDITVTVANAGAGLGFNLVGNPYPSPITMSTFLTTNTAKINSTFYFWRKTNGLGTAYCAYIPSGPTSGTFTNNGNGVDPAGVIQTGQGFIVDVKTLQTSIQFKNSHRVNNTAGQFFKTKEVATSDKVWLNATNAAGDFSQMAVTYDSNGTVGLDSFDGKYINDSEFALTSNINDGEYTIQGRPNFDSSDVVGLNFKAITAGDYTIAIDHTEGVFATGQDIYLVDSTTGTETNLKTDGYTFTAPAGTSNARFSLKYQKTLKVDAPAFNDNSVAVYKNKGTLYVNSGAIAIANIKVYDIQGRLIAEQKNVKANAATINNLKVTNQVLVVQVTSEDNKVVTKKVVN
jgi:hypothetical protein